MDYIQRANISTGSWFILVCWERISSSLTRKKSPRIYSRIGPRSIRTVPHHQCGLGFYSVILPYGDRWRLHRSFFHQTFWSDAVHRFLPSQHRKACHLLRRLLDSPEQLSGHVFEHTAIIMNSTYDYGPASRQD
ncbi:hypothetical protein HD554DRAFT_978828 [Boletus coccyginus]|nr:hypothetical protein HD554DRAFT_978828 [Boletus coccyginus]